MDFTLAGYRQQKNVRHYVFQGASGSLANRTRVVCHVGADLDLIRKYAIPIQDLPLLCRRLLEGVDEAVQGQSLILTEADMTVYAANRDALRRASEKKPKPDRNQASEPGEAGA